LEMGLSMADTTILGILGKDKVYSKLFTKMYSGDQSPVTWARIREALAVYVNSLNSYASPYDHYKAGNSNAISLSAKAGERLFFSSRFQCSTCHKPPDFGADSTMPAYKQFVNVGLYNHKNGNYPSTDQGLFNVSGKEADKGKFKIPSLRNLQYTAPYFHDGSAETLNEALRVFEEGGRNITYGEWQGDGRANPHKSPLIKKVVMSPSEKQNLLDFIQSLNDTTILTQPRFRSPYEDTVISASKGR
jgi:cytochrome c peroxidase